MTIFLSGGCKNGKSTLAEDCAVALAAGGPLYYLATMIPHDDEDALRIRRHIAARDGKGFETIECGRDIVRALDQAAPNAAFLLDSVTALLSNEMFHDGVIDADAAERTANDLRRLVERANHIVFVSDFLYSDAPCYDELTEDYRRGLALCDRTLAEVCDTVVEVCTGHYTVYKGALPHRKDGSRWN